MAAVLIGTSLGNRVHAALGKLAPRLARRGLVLTPPDSRGVLDWVALSHLVVAPDAV